LPFHFSLQHHFLLPLSSALCTYFVLLLHPHPVFLLVHKSISLEVNSLQSVHQSCLILFSSRSFFAAIYPASSFHFFFSQECTLFSFRHQSSFSSRSHACECLFCSTLIVSGPIFLHSRARNLLNGQRSSFSLITSTIFCSTLL
jgi:hypothetical protein